VVGQALQLQGHGPQGLGAGRKADPRQGLQVATPGQGVAHGRVACQGLDVGHGPPRRGCRQGLLDAPVLVAQRDLQVQDLLPPALEAEVSRLDHSGVHGPHRHLVDLLAPDLEEVGQARMALGKANRLEPGVALGADAPLLEELAFEPVGLGMLGGERRVGSFHHRGRQLEPARWTS